MIAMVVLRVSLGESSRKVHEIAAIGREHPVPATCHYERAIAPWMFASTPSCAKMTVPEG